MCVPAGNPSENAYCCHPELRGDVPDDILAGFLEAMTCSPARGTLPPARTAYHGEHHHDRRTDGATQEHPCGQEDAPRLGGRSCNIRVPSRPWSSRPAAQATRIPSPHPISVPQTCRPVRRGWFHLLSRRCFLGLLPRIGRDLSSGANSRNRSIVGNIGERRLRDDRIHAFPYRSRNSLESSTMPSVVRPVKVRVDGRRLEMDALGA